jgi:hypothetical protein
MERTASKKPRDRDAHAHSIAIAAASGVDPKTARKVLESGLTAIRSRPLANAIAAAAQQLGIALPVGAA